jgi:hypothetical protein
MWGARCKRGRAAGGHAWQWGGALGGHARPRGAYARTPIDGHGLPPRGWCGRISAPIIGAQTRGAHDFKEGPIYVLPSSFEVAKPSSPGSLPSTCKELCLGLWKLGDLALHTYGEDFY